MNQAERYLALQDLREGHEIDSSYRAAFFILTRTADIYEVAKNHVNREGIDFSGIKKQCSQLEESAIQAIDIAHNLFSYRSECEVTPFDMSRLAYPYMEAVCNSLYIASGQIKVNVVQHENDVELELDTAPYARTIQIHRRLNRDNIIALDIPSQDAGWER